MYNFNKYLKNQSNNWGNHNEGFSLQKEYMMQTNNDNNLPKLLRVITPIYPFALSINPTTYTSILILDPMFPDHKACSTDGKNTIFGRRFGIPWKISDKNGLYEELPMMKFCVYTIYQLEMIILSLILKLTSLKTYHHSEFHGNFGMIQWKMKNGVTTC